MGEGPRRQKERKGERGTQTDSKEDGGELYVAMCFMLSITTGYNDMGLWLYM